MHFKSRIVPQEITLVMRICMERLQRSRRLTSARSTAVQSITKSLCLPRLLVSAVNARPCDCPLLRTHAISAEHDNRPLLCCWLRPVHSPLFPPSCSS